MKNNNIDDKKRLTIEFSEFIAIIFIVLLGLIILCGLIIHKVKTDEDLTRAASRIDTLERELDYMINKK